MAAYPNTELTRVIPPYDPPVEPGHTHEHALLSGLTDVANPHAVSLDEVNNPGADKSFTMSNKLLAFRYTTPSPAGEFGGAFEIEGIGAFSGDLLHVHQHTGSPGTCSLAHFEAEDADCLPFKVTGVGTHAAEFTKTIQIDTLTASQIVKTDANKRLVSGATLDHATELTNVGTNTHTAIDSHIAAVTGNPHVVTAAELGLGSSDTPTWPKVQFTGATFYVYSDAIDLYAVSAQHIHLAAGQNDDVRFYENGAGGTKMFQMDGGKWTFNIRVRSGTTTGTANFGSLYVDDTSGADLLQFVDENDMVGAVMMTTTLGTEPNSLTAAELAELQNIGSVTISNTQWGYLGALNQGLTTTSTPQFARLGLGVASESGVGLKVSGFMENDGVRYATKWVKGTFGGTGLATVAHGITSGSQRILFCQAWYEQSTNVGNPLTIGYFDNSNVRITGGAAGTNYRISIVYTDATDGGW